jgi:hypothetical protein
MIHDMVDERRMNDGIITECDSVTGETGMAILRSYGGELKSKGNFSLPEE